MSTQQKVKAYELRKGTESNLVESLNRFRSELVSLRTSKVSSAPQVKLARIRVSNTHLFRHSISEVTPTFLRSFCPGAPNTIPSWTHQCAKL